MKSLASRVAAWALSAALAISFVPSAAFADAGVGVQKAIDSTVISDPGAATNMQDGSNGEQGSGSSSVDGSEQGANVVQSSEAFEFVYVDAREVSLGDTQSIVVSFVDPSNADTAVLWYQKAGGELAFIRSSQIEDGAALFELSFGSQDQTGTYSLVKVAWGADASHEAAIPQDSGSDFSFEVVGSTEETELEGVSVYSIGEDGELSEEESVSAAIDESLDANEGISLLSRSAEPADRSGNMVIALDPGHGGSDPGAVNGALREATLNLKIATYCKSVLDQYSGVTTFMTRTSDEYVGLADRVARAVDAGADVFVSFHINSTPKATGFEVWIQNDSSWRYELHEEGEGLAAEILDKLARFGLANRGDKESDSQNGNTYADGSPADYLTVLYESRLNNVPAVLIEHGFINGSSADQALLSDENSLRAMGEADAEAIIDYYGLTKGIPDAFDPSATYEKAIDDGTYVVNSSLSALKVLDVPSASAEEGVALQLYDSNGTDAQKFQVVRDRSAGYYTITNVNSGLVLGLNRNQDGTYGTRVVQQAKDVSSNSQKWIISRNSDGTSTLRNAVNAAYAVDVADASTANGTAIQLFSSNGTAAQKFGFLPADPSVSGERTVDDGLYVVRNAGSGKVLDVACGSVAAGANVQQYSANGTAAQKFLVEYDGEGFYTLVNLKSGLPLEVQEAFPVASTNVRQGASVSGDAQKWAISESGDGAYTLTSKATGLVLDVADGSSANGANVQACAANGSAAQRFSFESAKGPKAVEDGEYAVFSLLGSSMALDVADGSSANGAAIQLYRANGTAAQAFRFSYDEATGFYTITNVGSGKVFDLRDANTADGTRIQQYAPNGTLAQRWVVSEAGGALEIRSALDTSRCVDVAGGSSANGTAINLYLSNGTLAQRFRLVSLVPPDVSGGRTVDDGLYVVRNAGSGKVLDVACGSVAAGANVQQYSANGTAAQKFLVEYDGEGFYTLVNLKSGLPLEVQEAFPVASTNVRQGASVSGDAQKWAISESGDGAYTLTSKATGLVLDVADGSSANGANVQACAANGSAAQRFSFESAKGPKAVEDGEYAVFSLLGSSMALDVADGSSANGAAIQLYRANGTAAQAFRFSYDEATGFYTITNVGSGKVFDLRDANTADGTRIQQYAPNGTLAQRWVVSEAGGALEIRSALDTSRCVDVAGGGSANGTAINLYASNGTDAQRFRLVDFDSQYLIMGSSGVTSQQLAQHYASKVGSSYPSAVYSGKGAPSISEFCELLVEEARTEGVRADVLYAQIMLETNYLRFGGDVSAGQCNFGGLGATGNGNPGLSFPDVRTGLRASVQHLKAYASTDDLVNKCVDPRFGYVDRGCAPSVYDLSGKWASDPQYGSKIVSIMNEL